MKFLTILFFCYNSILFGQQNFYVSTEGQIKNDGLTLQTALPTIEDAKQAVAKFRLENRNYTQDVIINISSGIYYLSQTLIFDNNDGGKDNQRIIYRKNPTQKGEIKIFGGRIIEDWQHFDDSKNIWKAEIGNQFARQIYIRNKQTGEISKAIRARSNENFRMRENRKGYKAKTRGVDFSQWKNIRDLEVISNLYWVSTRIPVIGNEKAKKLIAEPEFWRNIHNQWNVYEAPFSWLENALELVDLPNEWYIDRLSKPDSNTIYFQFGNKKPDDLEIILPLTDKLISAENLKNITFEDLDFEFTTWNGPSVFIPEKQSNDGFRTGLGDRYTEYAYATHNYKNIAQIPAALSFDNCNNVKIRNCYIAHIGSTAIEFKNNSSNNLIENNEFFDISGSGISFHNWKSSDNVFRNGLLGLNKLPVGHGNQILNNKIHNIANDYLSSCGIVIGYAQNTTIKNNEITNFPYSGIAFISYNYNNIADDGTILRPENMIFFGTNEVSGNYIDCSAQVMSDGGGIYTLGYHGNDFDVPKKERTQIFNNIILNQKFYQGAIYIDKYSSNLDIYDNIIDIRNENKIEIKYHNPVYSIAYRYGSSNINIYNNYCNSRYESIPSSCLDGKSCLEIQVDNNEIFKGFEAYKE